MTDEALAYMPFDQERWLPDPPWKPTDPALQAWEKAHGHDVRLKCYSEFGCQAIEKALDHATVELDRLRDGLQILADKIEAEALTVPDDRKTEWGKGYAEGLMFGVHRIRLLAGLGTP
jgi:hypothetical protein